MPLGVALAGTAGADTNDERFLAEMNAEHLPRNSQAQVIDAGHAVCTALHAGKGFDDVMTAGAKSGLDPKTTGTLVGAAVSVYCPDQMDAARKWASSKSPKTT